MTIAEPFSALRRLRTLFDLRVEETGFMSQRLADGNDSNLIATLRIHQRNDDTPRKTKSDKSLFVIVFARVLDFNQRSIEDDRGVAVVNAVFDEISFPLGFVPWEHLCVVATLCRYVKSATLTHMRANVQILSLPKAVRWNEGLGRCLDATYLRSRLLEEKVSDI